MSAPENVWDYPRPPLLEPTPLRLEVVVAGETVAATTRALRVLETSHPPTYYLPPDDVRMELLEPNARRSFCEFKGDAVYWDIVVGETRRAAAAWSYPEPFETFAALRDHLAFYAQAADLCTVDGEPVRPQPGDFYGGWVTSHVQGPFKGGPGTVAW